MTLIRVGTRGSDLALWQTRWVCGLLQQAHPELRFEEVVIRTHGDIAAGQPLDHDFPVGGFVSAIELALLERRIDLAVHSYKDLPTAETPGLRVAAVPSREAPHDVLITREAAELARLPSGFRVGTSSPRRAAQLRRIAEVTIVPIRGNVPTRVAKVERELDGVMLAAAGIRRLGLRPVHMIDLPVEQFVPAPAQGALAVQTRADDPLTTKAAAIEDSSARLAVEAERSFLRNVHAGCHTPVGALASVHEGVVSLHAQLFTDDAARMVEGVEVGRDPSALGRSLAERLLRELHGRT